MASEPIKFRCSACHKLLGVSPHKVGEVVHCPKCSAEVVVPSPEPAAVSPPQLVEDDPDPSRIFRDMFRVDPPSGEFPDFSPADIRATTGFEPPLATGSMTLELSHSQSFEVPPIQAKPADPVKSKASPKPTPAPAPVTESGFPLIRTEPVTLRPDPPRRPRPEPVVEPSIPPIRVEPAIPAFFEAPTELPSTLPRITVEVPPPPIAVASSEYPPITAEPPLRAEPASVLLERSTPRRSDVVLPRTAVLLWSFFVVLALVTSFAAGLLAGHFVWVTKPAG